MALVYAAGVPWDTPNTDKRVYIYISPLHFTGDIVRELPPNSYMDDGVLRTYPNQR
jgi:hypothetical protein